MKLVIVEDDPIINEFLAEAVGKMGHEVVERYYKARVCLDAIEKIEFDLAILDINLGEALNGIDVGQVIRKIGKEVIILTSYGDDALLAKVKELGPSSFLMKPIIEQELKANLEIVEFRLNKQNNIDPVQDNATFIFVKTNVGLLRVELEDILFFEGYDNYVLMYTKDKKHILSRTLKSIVDQMNPRLFVRVHRSYIVHVQHIDTIQSKTLYVGKHKLKIGDTYYGGLLDVIPTMRK